MKNNTLSIVFVLTLPLVAVIALATPSSGFLLNQVIAMGTSLANISQQVQIAGPNGEDPWQLQLQAQGPTDFYVNQLVIAPGGHSGWHSHPGVLIGAVTAGSIDFYDSNCRKRTVNAGDVYLENSEPHAIINNGTTNAELTIGFIVKRSAARRIDESAPACAPSTNIP